MMGTSRVPAAATCPLLHPRAGAEACQSTKLLVLAHRHSSARCEVASATAGSGTRAPAAEPSAADDGVYLDLYQPARIEEPLDNDEARCRSDCAEGLAVYLRDSVTVSRIHEEHARSNHVTKRRARFAKRFIDDLKAPSGLHADVGVDVAVRPDRSGCGNEDEVLVPDSATKADGRLQRRALADVLPHVLQAMPRIRGTQRSSSCW